MRLLFGRGCPATGMGECAIDCDVDDAMGGVLSAVWLLSRLGWQIAPSTGRVPSSFFDTVNVNVDMSASANAEPLRTEKKAFVRPEAYTTQDTENETQMGRRGSSATDSSRAVEREEGRMGDSRKTQKGLGIQSGSAQKMA